MTTERHVTKGLREVVRLLLSGECSTIKAAACRVDMNATHVGRALKLPHVRAFMEQQTRQSVAAGTLRASARMLELIDAGSEHVSLDAAKHVLAIAGIKPAAVAQVNVNIDVKAGYVIDLSEPPS